MTVYVLASPKGGVWKTTTAAELAYQLAQRGRRVLAVDLDQQSNLTARLGITGRTPLEGTASDVLNGELDAAAAATAAPSAPGVKILVGTHDLTGVEQSPPPDLATSLRDHLPTVAGFDDVVIDTAPSLSGITLAGLAAADVVVCPVAMATESYDQVARLEQVIANKLARRIRPGLAISWLVPTHHDRRRRLDREMLDALRGRYPGRVTTPVREAVAVRDAYTAGLTITAYDPKSHAAEDYRTVIDMITTEVQN